MEIVGDFIFLGSKITADGDCSHEIKRYLLLGRKATEAQLSPIFSAPGSFLTDIHSSVLPETAADPPKFCAAFSSLVLYSAKSFGFPGLSAYSHLRKLPDSSWALPVSLHVW